MKRIAIAALLVLLAASLAGCNGGGTKSQKEQQKLTNAYSERLQAAVPYPLSQMTDSLERRNLRERLLRFNKPDKIGYVYILGFNGNFVGYYTIKGKVSSTQSQMTITQQVVHDCHSGCREVVDSMGDDGSYGQNETGIFFFTTNNVLVTTDMHYIYSDSPLPVEAKPINPKQGQANVSNRTGG